MLVAWIIVGSSWEETFISTWSFYRLENWSPQKKGDVPQGTGGEWVTVPRLQCQPLDSLSILLQAQRLLLNLQNQWQFENWAALMGRGFKEGGKATEGGRQRPGRDRSGSYRNAVAWPSWENGSISQKGRWPPGTHQGSHWHSEFQIIPHGLPSRDQHDATAAAKLQNGPW